jgi:hypothetical protein
VDLVYSCDQVQGRDFAAEAVPVGIYGGAIVTYIVREVQGGEGACACAAGTAYESVADAGVGPCTEYFDRVRGGG